jgi:hypothetical protein
MSSLIALVGSFRFVIIPYYRLTSYLLTPLKPLVNSFSFHRSPNSVTLESVRGYEKYYSAGSIAQNIINDVKSVLDIIRIGYNYNVR